MKEANNTYVFPIPDETIQKYETTDVETLSNQYVDLYRFYLKDDILSKARKMLMTEKFNIPKASKLVTELFINMPLKYLTTLFEK